VPYRILLGYHTRKDNDTTPPTGGIRLLFCM